MTVGIQKAQEEVRRSGNLPIPSYLKDAHYKSASKLGHGIGYQYAHDFPNHYVVQQYLPDEIKDVHFYSMSNIGYEGRLQKWFDAIGKKYAREKKK